MLGVNKQKRGKCTPLIQVRGVQIGAPEKIRTSDTGFRRAVLYPLSYWGGDVAHATRIIIAVGRECAPKGCVRGRLYRSGQQP